MAINLQDLFLGVAAKYLSAVDAEPTKSNQHEIGGLIKAGFRDALGEPQNGEKSKYQAHLVYISDEDDFITCNATVTWYDSRYNSPNRSAEYRLYYETTVVTSRLKEGDFFLIGMHQDGHLLMVFSPPGSPAENQLRWLFGINEMKTVFSRGNLTKHEIVLPVQMLLEELGINLFDDVSENENFLELILQRFGETGFPSTAVFSEFARQLVSKDVDPLHSPDATLIHWMGFEEKLFRIYERYHVQKKLKEGFGEKGDDVDEFISYSLSVQNRRKSRVGHAFEGHLEKIFQIHQIRFERGGKGKVTENGNRPDFIFPSFNAYHTADYPASSLLMLGAKTTCKDRWRQVLSEADRLPVKHLITLEAAISCTQTDEMRAKNLQLIVPKSLHVTYTEFQQSWLMDLNSFIKIARN